jgi:hypothetical protein
MPARMKTVPEKGPTATALDASSTEVAVCPRQSRSTAARRAYGAANHTEQAFFLFKCMGKEILVAGLVLILTPLAHASSPCPFTLVSGEVAPHSLTLTFWNTGKLPIRRLELNCTLVRAQANKTESIPCREQNALFFPGPEYTVSYAFAGALPRSALVSLKSVTLSNGFIWKSSRRQPCRAMKIYSKRAKK